MSSARTSLRPSRRSLLHSGTLPGAVGLAGCDVTLPWSGPAPRASVTLAPLTTSVGLLPKEPVFREDWALSPTDARPLGLLVHREKNLEADLRVVTPGELFGHPVPLDPTTSGIVVDAHVDSVRIYTRGVREGRYRTTLLTSSEYTEWATTELGTTIDRRLAAAGDGLVVSRPAHGTVQVWEVAEDGAVAALAPIAVPAGETWGIDGIARSGDRILVVLSQRTEVGEDPAAVSSEDGGATWTEAVPLPGEGRWRGVRDVLVAGERFVLIGYHDLPVAWDENVTFRRAAAWSGTSAQDLAGEDVPLPTWGIEDFSQTDGRGSLDPDTPIDFADLSLGLPVRSADGAALLAPTFFADDCRRLRREEDGTWTVSAKDRYAVHSLFGAVLDETATLYRVHDRVLGSTGEHPHDRDGLPFAQARSLSVPDGATGAGLTGEFSWRVGTMVRTDERISWRTEQDGFTFGVDAEDRVVRRLTPALGPDAPSSISLHCFEGSLTLVAGIVSDGEDPGVHAQVSADGAEWESASGLLRSDHGMRVGRGTTVAGTHYLPLAEWVPGEGDDDAVLTPGLYASEDGLTWEAVPPPTIEHPSPELAAHGGQILEVTAVDGTLIALGLVQDVEDARRPVLFVQDGESWVTVAPEGAAPGWSFAGVVGTTVHGWVGSRRAESRLAVDGTLTETYRSDDDTARGPVLDLGEGALIAGGWIDRPVADEEDDSTAERGVGACLWASRDAGETWQRTMLPGQDGRFPGVTVRQEGDGLLVLLDDPDTPRGYRIHDARADVLGTEEE
ncbi:hypothetical protein [Brachybacterium saurashtrense]|uniref:Exo-alpha-sialidase n=1 Tax=Brachybacterium saurashtrense TaxID=556288 RepID=A0A345YK02_9MICO|nr:hypothetical protein [Brachybacterium saurashtrense]AXK44254.1 hypothetical protein DWV08_00500 [Brachybacterium saurashtrense]RRR21526.1 hypothetical protein DXU92_14400 [Brachybacterium saurashtrense]